jgi:plasmid rolling circle replication initiator protein Rep
MDFLFRLLQIVNKKKEQRIEDRHPMLEKQGVRVRGKKVKYASNCKSHSLG